MKDWKAAVRTWEIRGEKHGKKDNLSKLYNPDKEYDVNLKEECQNIISRCNNSFKQNRWDFI